MHDSALCDLAALDALALFRSRQLSPVELLDALIAKKAKIDADKLDLMPTAVHLPTFLEAIVGICRTRAEQKHLTFVYEPQPQLPA